MTERVLAQIALGARRSATGRTASRIEPTQARRSWRARRAGADESRSADPTGKNHQLLNAMNWPGRLSNQGSAITRIAEPRLIPHGVLSWILFENEAPSVSWALCPCPEASHAIVAGTLVEVPVGDQPAPVDHLAGCFWRR